MFGLVLTGPTAHARSTATIVVLAIVARHHLLVATNLVRGRIGRSWMMIRDMDIAAELMGIRPLVAKLSAFAVSSYICGVAGRACSSSSSWARPSPPPSRSRSPSRSCSWSIIGGLGSLIGCYLGAAFIWILPIVPAQRAADARHRRRRREHRASDLMIVGALIILFLIVEPHGLARLWQIAKEKLRVWPFPYA